MKVINKFLLSFFLIQFMYLGYSQSDTNSNDVQKKIKIDGVAAVVGDYVILESDVDKTLIDLQSQGVSTQNIGRCSLLGKLMEDKLYAHHAEQDSLEVDNNQIYSYVDRTIDYFVDQLGSLEKVLEFYKKDIENKISENNILISAHGNSIRALCKYLFKLDENQISKLEIPTGNPLLITLDGNKKITDCKYLDDERAKDLVVF